MIQGIREEAVIKILENGVRLSLKLQTSHIASMYFETWLDKKKNSFTDPVAPNTDADCWLDQVKQMKPRDLRNYIDLITLSCILLAAKVNEQNPAQPSINDVLRLVRNKFEFEDFIEMERYLITECLNWKLNITTPYHFSDCIQGMGCLFWTDFDCSIRDNFRQREPRADQGAKVLQYRMVLFLIQFRKYINYFVEQSLINGLWGHYPQDVIAIASIIIARFEMINI